MNVFNQKSSNPVFSDKIFRSVTDVSTGATMTIRGTMGRFAFLLLMAFGTASFTWTMYAAGAHSTARGLMISGLVVGLVLAIVLAFRPKLSPVLAPLYGLAEGLFLGGISGYVNEMFALSYPGIVTHAVGLTFCVAVAMLGLYTFRVIRVTDKLRSIITMAITGICLFYLLSWILGMFGVNIPVLQGSGVFAIVFSVIVVGIASLSLLLDFDNIETMTNQNAPKYMEWYCAFGLLVTIVWLYIEILRLLMKISSSRE